MRPFGPPRTRRGASLSPAQPRSVAPGRFRPYNFTRLALTGLAARPDALVTAPLNLEGGPKGPKATRHAPPCDWAHRPALRPRWWVNKGRPPTIFRHRAQFWVLPASGRMLLNRRGGPLNTSSNTATPACFRHRPLLPPTPAHKAHTVSNHTTHPPNF